MTTVFNPQDKSTWQSHLFESNPEIQNLCERVHPTRRVTTFLNLFKPGKPEVKEVLTRDVVLKVILQHLKQSGYAKTVKVLEKEAHIKFEPKILEETRLLAILRQAVDDVERLYDLTIADKVDGGQEEVDDIEQGPNDEQLEEALFDMGLMDDERATEEDVNLWDEEEDNESNIIFDAKAGGTGTDAVKAGSLNKLVTRLTSEKQFDANFVKTFLMTYQSFATPAMFLKKLIQRYNVPFNGEGDEAHFRSSVQQPVRLRVCNVMKKWIEEYFQDFTEKVIETLQQFINEAATKNTAVAQTLKKSLAKQMQLRNEGGSEMEKKRQFTEPPPEPKVPLKVIFSPSLSLHHIDEEEAARQLTFKDFSYYSSIQPSELLNQAWSKAKLKHRARNVLRMIHHFNEVSTWAAVTVLQEKKLRVRTKLMAMLIGIAEHCLRLNNFSTSMAIIAGLNNSAVHRLKHTKEDLPKKATEDLKRVSDATSSENAYSEYRANLTKINPPCIPYLGVYLTDLTFIEDGNPDFTKGLINFWKRKLIYGVIAKIQQFQQRAYNLQPVHQIISFLDRFDACDDQELYNLSLAREPRNAEKATLE